MARFTLYILEQSMTREIVGSDRIAWIKRVNSQNRRDALAKCLPEIKNEVFPLITDETIKIVSVYVGMQHSVSYKPSRLMPIQVRLNE